MKNGFTEWYICFLHTFLNPYLIRRSLLQAWTRWKDANSLSVHASSRGFSRAIVFLFYTEVHIFDSSIFLADFTMSEIPSLLLLWVVMNIVKFRKKNTPAHGVFRGRENPDVFRKYQIVTRMSHNYTWTLNFVHRANILALTSHLWYHLFLRSFKDSWVEICFKDKPERIIFSPFSQQMIQNNARRNKNSSFLEKKFSGKIAVKSLQEFYNIHTSSGSVKFHMENDTIDIIQKFACPHCFSNQNLRGTRLSNSRTNLLMGDIFSFENSK